RGVGTAPATGGFGWRLFGRRATLHARPLAAAGDLAVALADLVADGFGIGGVGGYGGSGGGGFLLAVAACRAAARCALFRHWISPELSRRHRRGRVDGQGNSESACELGKAPVGWLAGGHVAPAVMPSAPKFR